MTCLVAYLPYFTLPCLPWPRLPATDPGSPGPISRLAWLGLAWPGVADDVECSLPYLLKGNPRNRIGLIFIDLDLVLDLPLVVTSASFNLCLCFGLH